MFCPKCKSVMRPHKVDDRIIYQCDECGEQLQPDDLEQRHVIKDVPKPEEKKGEGVADERNPLAVHDHKCSKCGYGKAQLIEKGIWYSDEDHVVLYKCGRCGHTEMEKAKIK